MEISAKHRERNPRQGSELARWVEFKFIDRDGSFQVFCMILKIICFECSIKLLSFK